MGISGINPKGLLFFVALVPQFVSPDAALPVPVQSGLLGLTFVLLVAVIYSCVALLARKLLQSRPGAARQVTLASGIIMLVLGAVLLAEQIVPAVSAALNARLRARTACGYLRCMYHSVKDDARPSAVSWMTHRLS